MPAFFSEVPPVGVALTILDACLVFSALVAFILVRNKKIGVLFPLFFLWGSIIPYVVENVVIYQDKIVSSNHHMEIFEIDVESMVLGSSARGLVLIASIFYAVKCAEKKIIE